MFGFGTCLILKNEHLLILETTASNINIDYFQVCKELCTLMVIYLFLIIICGKVGTKFHLLIYVKKPKLTSVSELLRIMTYDFLLLPSCPSLILFTCLKMICIHVCTKSFIPPTSLSFERFLVHTC